MATTACFLPSCVLLCYCYPQPFRFSAMLPKSRAYVKARQRAWASAVRGGLPYLPPPCPSRDVSPGSPVSVVSAPPRSSSGSSTFAPPGLAGGRPVSGRGGAGRTIKGGGHCPLTGPAAAGPTGARHPLPSGTGHASSVSGADDPRSASSGPGDPTHGGSSGNIAVQTLVTFPAIPADSRPRQGRAAGHRWLSLGRQEGGSSQRLRARQACPDGSGAPRGDCGNADSDATPLARATHSAPARGAQ